MCDSCSWCFPLGSHWVSKNTPSQYPVTHWEFKEETSSNQHATTAPENKNKRMSDDVFSYRLCSEVLSSSVRSSAATLGDFTCRNFAHRPAASLQTETRTHAARPHAQPGVIIQTRSGRNSYKPVRSSTDTPARPRPGPPCCEPPRRRQPSSSEPHRL